MIMKEAVTSYLLTLSKFCTKRGTDITVNAELIQAINVLTADDAKLVGIYVNTREHFNIPDVCVIHCYDWSFRDYLLDPDSEDLCPYGFTIEIHARCFDKYTDEELGALILHDILQNVMSDTTKIRFLKAYTAALNRHNNVQVIEMFNRVQQDEAIYIAYMELCIRPFRVPAKNAKYMSTDDVLRTFGLADAYDSYLVKANAPGMSNPEEEIEQVLRDDIRDVATVINVCMDDALHSYYKIIRQGVPLLTLENVLRPSHATRFVMVANKPTKKPCGKSLSESLNNPETEYEIRYQIDKIIGNMRYAESEAEREVVLFKIKQLSIRLAKKLQKYQQLDAPSKITVDKINFLQSCLEELENLRKTVVNMEIKAKRWSIYSKVDMPEGYDM
mgnify:CR=1 FL=1